MILDNLSSLIARGVKDVVSLTTNVGSVIIDEIGSIPDAVKDGYEKGGVSSLFDEDIAKNEANGSTDMPKT